MISDRLAGLIQSRLDELQTTAYAVEQRSPLRRDAIRNILRGSDPQLRGLSQICDALGLELYIGPPRRDPSTPVIDPITENLAMIRRYDIVASAGNGSVVNEEALMEPLAFRRDWLASQGIRADDVALIKARGTSMEPIISDGDLVMVDLSKTEVPILRKGRRARRALYWVVRHDGDLRVKDVERTDSGSFVVTSENTYAYRPEVVSPAEGDDFEIVGRVVWWGHTVPL